MRNDFIGFTYNNIHSSSLGIVRTSDGSRFNENLLPIMQDKTVQVPGGDGTYYFGSYYTQKQFNVSFAFDSLTETQFRRLRSHFGDKKIHPLIFDELPYKEYQAKVTGSATIKHICFEENGVRIYKGEGSVQFTAYYPFARSTFKFLKDAFYKVNISQAEYKPNLFYIKGSDGYQISTENYNVNIDYFLPIDNVEEWADSSGMRQKGLYNELNPNSGKLDFFIPNQNGFYIYNPGDIETDFIMKLYFQSGIIPSGNINLGEDGKDLYFSEIKKKKSDAGIQINTKLNLIEGIDSAGKRTGQLYNDCIISGSFFKIPKIGPDEEIQTLFVDLNGTGQNFNPQLQYDYYYF